MKIDDSFLSIVAYELGHTDTGLKGAEIVRHFNAFAFRFKVTIPFSLYPFVPNSTKRVAFLANIKAFPSEQQYKIIHQLCDLEIFTDNIRVQEIKILLEERFHELGENSFFIQTIKPKMEKTSQSLINFPKSKAIFTSAIAKIHSEELKRNVLDDIRLSLELFLKDLLDNDKPIEKQKAEIGQFAKRKGSSSDIRNMFTTLLDYFSKYQNTYVKHDDAVKYDDAQFILELACNFVDYLTNLSKKKDEDGEIE